MYYFFRLYEVCVQCTDLCWIMQENSSGIVQSEECKAQGMFSGEWTSLLEEYTGVGQAVRMPKGLMKRLSKSATDLSPCKKKTRSNSDDEELEDRSQSESARTDVSEEDGERPSSAQSSVSVPAISLIGSTKRINYHFRGRSRSEHHHRPARIPHERSIAAEIAAVPKTSNYGIFGLLKLKFGLSNRERHRATSANHCPQFQPEDDGPPQVVRIKCEAEFNPNYMADTESGGSPSPQRKPQVIRRKVTFSENIKPARKLKLTHLFICCKIPYKLITMHHKLPILHHYSSILHIN